MFIFDLSGKWKVTQAGAKRSIAAVVPGCVHTDLLEAGKIEDPYYRDNEKSLQWIGETDWVYTRRFEIGPEILNCERVILRCEGLDTLATVRINGKKIAKTDNMFRTWEFDIKKVLKKGPNTIEVKLDSTLSYLRKQQRKHPIPTWLVPAVQDWHCQWIRKEPCNYGWDWGPKLITCGIWRDIYIVAFDTARIDEIHMQQKHTKSRVVLDISVKAQKVKACKLNVQTAVYYKNKKVAECETPLKGKTAKAKIVINNPKLWWPNGMGEQNLYDVNVDLVDKDGGLLDSDTKRIGLRTLKLKTKNDRWGQSFKFVVNGVEFFAKGANWIPADTFTSRLSYERYEYLLESAVEANMNMLRVWGGGIYENDIFYDLCDELGICIWQDFMFACSTYPTFNDAFMENVRAEFEDNIRRLRHHACIALWCGNNELEMGLVSDSWDNKGMSWADYGKLFDKLLPSVVKKHDRQRDYWPGSPHSPRGDRSDYNNPDSGDAHMWEVWHRKAPFEWYRTSNHRFYTEFGFQSFPEPKTVREFTLPKDRNVTSPVMEHHQRSLIGNTVIMQYMLDWFRVPKNFEMTLWLSQILHGMGMQYAVEHFRHNMPRTMGALYWQLNDCWPAASWASIDSKCRWKALHYFARRFYSPLLVSAEEYMPQEHNDIRTAYLYADQKHRFGQVDVFVTSDLLKVTSAKLSWTLTDLNGQMIVTDTTNVKALPGKSQKVFRLDVSEPLEVLGKENALLWLELSLRGEIVSRNLVGFAKPKYMELSEPGITSKVKPAGKGLFLVTLKAKRPALWAWIELVGIDAEYSDNFMNIQPGQEVHILVRPEKGINKKNFVRKLRIRSLVDTY